jgi:hypothetical protein
LRPVVAPAGQARQKICNIALRRAQRIDRVKEKARASFCEQKEAKKLY